MSQTSLLPARQRAVWLIGPEQVELREVPLPPPGTGEIVVRIGAALTCGTDLKVFRRGGHPRMLEVPGPFGHEAAGTVAAVGAGVGSCREGDRVVVGNSASCGTCERCLEGRENLCADLRYLNGAYAEYLAVPRRFVERSLHQVPAELPFAVAAMAEPLACVLHGVERTPLRPGSDVLVIGAGAIGLLFTAVLAARGQRVVTSDPHPERGTLASRLGAAATPLALREGDPPDLRALARDGQGFDAVIETSATIAGWETACRNLRTGGVVNLFAGPPAGAQAPLDLHALHYRELAIVGSYHHRPAGFREALQLLASGTLDAGALLSQERPLDDVAGALHAMGRREAVKVAIRPD